ncbi:MAG: hypothetical protein JSS11_14130 [Verrucomicrobia bacterium]|nr:hypothetical protein [Verrucomicrobiota bacterium]
MRRFLRLLAALALTALLSSCAMVHGWAGGGTGRSPHAGASVDIPLGK